MPKDTLYLVAPDPVADLERVSDLISKVFSAHKGYFGWREHLREIYLEPSHYDWKASRIGLMDAGCVTHYGIWDYRMRIGSARVRVGGVGAVATHGDFRRRGLMDRTARASVEAMADQGYDMSILFGIPNFYHKFGYVRSWADTIYLLDTWALPDAKPGRKLNKFDVCHREDIAGLFNSEHARLTGSAVRPTYRKNYYAGPWEGALWRDASRKTIGYFIFKQNGGQLEVAETAGDVDVALAGVAGEARRRGCGQVRFSTVFHDHPMAFRLRRLDCRVESRYETNSGPMITTINLESTLRKMCRELTRRLARSSLAGWTGDLLVEDARAKAMLSITAGKVQIAPPGATPHSIRGGDHIAQLLIGTAEPEETVRAADIKLRGDAKELVKVLFPFERPNLNVCDAY